ncbi:SUMO2 isoform 4 [Pongo abelii]|uniref:SUMO2 isoform 4 n=2 Tax=Boreoeutheria TaxID=1437010 RepID=A0A2J8Y0E7_PONAB|nr:SUMO2 isoform 4 [Pongo abelii]
MGGLGCSCSRTQGRGRERTTCAHPLPSSTAAASFFCRSWCCLCARLVRTWYLFCEAAAEETPALAMADEKPKGLSMRQIRFRFDGQPINETDTPAQLEMEDEDTIDVFQQQTGGVY